MNVIKVTKINADGSVAFDGIFGPNEVRYLLDQGVNVVLQEGAASIEGFGLDDEDDDDDEPLMIKGSDVVQ